MDRFIATAINDGDLMDCDASSSGGLISAFDAVDFMDCADITVSSDVLDVLIATAIDAGDTKYFPEDTADGLIATFGAGCFMDCADFLFHMMRRMDLLIIAKHIGYIDKIVN